MCGTASPKKIIGPQYAVIIADKIPVLKINKKRIRLIFTPKLMGVIFT